jgi:DNA polymerase I
MRGSRPFPEINELAENMNFQVLHGIVDCLWIIGTHSELQGVRGEGDGILTEVDSYDWIAFLPMADGSGAYNRYIGRLNYWQDEDPRSYSS